SRGRHTRFSRDWSSDVCSSDLSNSRSREGVTWTRERLFEGRLADLKERVDRDRVRLVQASLGEGVVLHAAAMAFAAEITALAEAGTDAFDVVAACARQAGVTEDV